MKKTLYFAIPAIAALLWWFRVLSPTTAILIVIELCQKRLSAYDQIEIGDSPQVR